MFFHLLCMNLACFPLLFSTAPEKLKVGQIIIVGNHITKDSVIRAAVGLYPGQALQYPALRLAERDLARLGLFDVDPNKGTRPTVTVLGSPADIEYRDILVCVTETPTGSLMILPGFTARGDLALRLVIAERNFDLLRWPTSLEDLCSGRAFRGAGQKVRVDVLQIPLLPCRVPLLNLLNDVLPSLFHKCLEVTSRAP